jgi:hypothetical protein
MLLKIVGAGAGAMAGNYVFDSFIVKKADGSGFIEPADGFGVDDILHWALVGVGAYFGMSLIGKVGG